MHAPKLSSVPRLVWYLWLALILFSPVALHRPGGDVGPIVATERQAPLPPSPSTGARDSRDSPTPSAPSFDPLLRDLEDQLSRATGQRDRLQLDVSTARKLASDGSFQLIGRVHGYPLSRYIFTHWKGAVYGHLQLPPLGDFELRWNKEQTRVVLSPIRSEHVRECEGNPEADADAIPGNRMGLPTAPEDAAATASGLAYFDMVIGYNEQARIASGGSALDPQDSGDVEAKILTAVATANSAYADSGISLSMRLAWLGPIDYPYPENESFNRALEELEAFDDGQADSLTDLQQQYGADFASLWLASDVTGGRANVLTNSLQNRFALSVIRVQNPVGTFVHEVGHNMGCRHLREGYDSTPSSWEPYAFAHHFVGDGGKTYATVMASFGDVSRLEDDGLDVYGRVDIFSNPLVANFGAITGTATEDCARCLNEHAFDYVGFFEYTGLQADLTVTNGTSSTASLWNAFVGREYSLYTGNAPDNMVLVPGSVTTDNSGSALKTIPSPTSTQFFQFREVP